MEENLIARSFSVALLAKQKPHPLEEVSDMMSLVDFITGCHCMAKPHVEVCHIDAAPERLGESCHSEGESSESCESSRSLGDALSVEGIPSWNFFESWTCPTDLDHPKQPNRLVHEYRPSRFVALCSNSRRRNLLSRRRSLRQEAKLKEALLGFGWWEQGGTKPGNDKTCCRNMYRICADVQQSNVIRMRHLFADLKCSRPWKSVTPSNIGLKRGAVYRHPWGLSTVWLVVSCGFNTSRCVFLSVRSALFPTCFCIWWINHHPAARSWIIPCVQPALGEAGVCRIFAKIFWHLTEHCDSSLPLKRTPSEAKREFASDSARQWSDVICCAASGYVSKLEIQPVDHQNLSQWMSPESPVWWLVSVWSVW